MNHIAIFQVAKFDVREKQIDEERNQESRPEEKGTRKNEEVAFGRARKRAIVKIKTPCTPPVSGAFFIVGALVAMLRRWPSGCSPFASARFCRSVCAWPG